MTTSLFAQWHFAMFSMKHQLLTFQRQLLNKKLLSKELNKKTLSTIASCFLSPFLCNLRPATASHGILPSSAAPIFQTPKKLACFGSTSHFQQLLMFFWLSISLEENTPLLLSCPGNPPRFSRFPFFLTSFRSPPFAACVYTSPLPSTCAHPSCHSGTQYRAAVEFAPWQAVPKDEGRKDPKEGSIEQGDCTGHSLWPVQSPCSK